MIAILVHNIEGGGVQRSLLHLAHAFQEQGREVEVLVLRGPTVDPTGTAPDVPVRKLARNGALGGRLAALRADPAGWRQLLLPVLIAPKTSWHVAYLPALADYLRTRQPTVLYTAAPYLNLAGIWARSLAGTATAVVVSERVAFSHFKSGRKRRQLRWCALPPLLARTYPLADAVVTVSGDVADEFAEATGLARERLTPIYNPVVGPRLKARVDEPVDHPWFAEDRRCPVVLGAGRLVDMKDFATLLRAFARLRGRRTARLVILGDGSRRPRLEALARRLGVRDDVDLPGWVANPNAFMARADLFVLSSRAEGLPNALIEAIACGCPVVATDCPSGPREVLEGGRWGPLVPVGDAAAMARAMADALDRPADRDALRARAEMFSVERSVAQHLELFDRAVGARATPRTPLAETGTRTGIPAGPAGSER